MMHDGWHDLIEFVGHYACFARCVPRNFTHFIIIIHNSFLCALHHFKNRPKMLIERTAREVIIRLPATVDPMGLQRLVDYLTYTETTAKSKATQAQVDKLANEAKKGWWKKNRNRFVP